ncbi:MAG TPA: APC family permease [Gaiellaceae bacterium]|nr:APC family permease [Gaiellaceae bacterium]
MTADEDTPTPGAQEKPAAQISVVGAAFLGIGAMIGAGIFALLGEAAAVAGSAVWLSFLLAGLVTGLLAYNVVKLGIRYPSSGGLIEYLMRGFGNGRLLGIASWLGYAAAFVIVCSMVAVSFGSYATSLFVGDDAWSGWDNVFTSILIVGMTAINMIGAKFVSRVASVMVVVLLGVFAIFIWVTVADVDFDMLAFSTYPGFADIIASIALTFFAFLGFGVMTFTVGNLVDPKRQLPRAMLLALGVTTATYVLIAIGVFGTLTVEETIRYGETAIAEAARPSLGDAGFTIMAIAALIATAGATNATLFGSTNMTAMLAEIRQFPPLFGRDSRLGPHGGLLITAGLVLLVSNLVDLSAIASVGSACALVVFLLVGVAGFRRRSETGASGVVVLLGVAATAIVLAFFAADTLQNAPQTFTAMIAILVIAVAADFLWKRRRPQSQTPAATPQSTPSV